MAWHPIRQDHSIEAVHWRVALLHPLGQRHQAWIQAKDARLRTVLPRVETQQKFLQIGPNGVTVFSDGASIDQDMPAHLRYERYLATGEVEIGLEVNGNAVTVVSRSYSQWSKTSGVVNQVLADIGTALREADDLPIVQLELEYKDVFWWDGTWEDDSLGKLLKPHRRLVPEWAFQAGPLWHADQGWVVSIEGCEDETVVERMFLQGVQGTVNDEPRPLLVMLTTVRLRPPQGQQALPLKMQDAFSALESVDHPRQTAQDRFDAMHDRAIRMFRDVLHPSMSERIGLT